jgi:toxin ParE1/3/4
MKHIVRFRPEAEAEALETRDWYEGRREGLGAEFRIALDRTIDRIVVNPFRYRQVRGKTRRAILDRFPHAVYFRVADDDVVVLAVHGRQHCALAGLRPRGPS